MSNFTDCQPELVMCGNVYWLASSAVFTVLLLLAANTLYNFKPNALAKRWWSSCKGQGLFLVSLGALARAVSMGGVWIEANANSGRDGGGGGGATRVGEDCSIFKQRLWTEVLWVCSHTFVLASVILMIAYLAEISYDGLDWAWSPRAAPTRLVKPMAAMLATYLLAEICFSSLYFLTRDMCGGGQTARTEGGSVCNVYLGQMLMEMVFIVIISGFALFYSSQILSFCRGSWAQNGHNNAARKLIAIAHYLRLTVVLSWLYVASLAMYIITPPPHRSSWSWLLISSVCRVLEMHMLVVILAYYGQPSCQVALKWCHLLCCRCCRCCRFCRSNDTGRRGTLDDNPVYSGERSSLSVDTQLRLGGGEEGNVDDSRSSYSRSDSKGSVTTI